MGSDSSIHPAPRGCQSRDCATPSAVRARDQPADGRRLGAQLSGGERGHRPAAGSRCGLLGLASTRPRARPGEPPIRRPRSTGKRLAARVEKKRCAEDSSPISAPRTRRGPSMRGPARPLRLLRGLAHDALEARKRSRARAAASASARCSTRVERRRSELGRLLGDPGEPFGAHGRDQRWIGRQVLGRDCARRSIATVTRRRRRLRRAEGLGAAAVDEHDGVSRGQPPRAGVRGLLPPENAGSLRRPAGAGHDQRASEHRHTHSFSDRRPASFQRRPAEASRAHRFSRSRVRPERRMRPAPSGARQEPRRLRQDLLGQHVREHEVEAGRRGRERTRVEADPRAEGVTSEVLARHEDRLRVGVEADATPGAQRRRGERQNSRTRADVEHRLPSSASSSSASRARRVERARRCRTLARPAGAARFGPAAARQSPDRPDRSRTCVRPGKGRDAARKASSGSPSAMSVVSACGCRASAERPRAAAPPPTRGRRRRDRWPTISNPRGPWRARSRQQGVVAGFLRHEQAAEAERARWPPLTRRSSWPSGRRSCRRRPARPMSSA